MPTDTRQLEFDAALDELMTLTQRPEGGWKAADDDTLFAAVLRLRTAREALSVSQPAPPVDLPPAPRCKVPWCDKYGRHYLDDDEVVNALAAQLGTTAATVGSRTCFHVTLDTPTGQVAAEVVETAGQLGRPYVGIDGRHDTRAFELDTPESVTELVTAILAAARVAFGTDRAARTVAANVGRS